MTTTSTTDPEGHPTPRKRRGRLIVFIATVVVVVAAAGVAYTLIHDDPDPHEANAGRVAKAMLADFTPPADAAPVSDTPKLDELVHGTGAGRQVNRTKRWHLAGDAMTVAQELAAHPPEGYQVQSNTPMKTGSGIIYVWFRPDRQTNPALANQGIRERALNLSVIDVDEDTVALLAQADVNWARSRDSNTKIPTRITRLVVATTPGSATPPVRARTQPRTVTRADDIDEISKMLDSLDPGPDFTGAVDCFGHPETNFGAFHLSFGTPDDNHAASAVVDTAGCRWVKITVDGRSVGNYWGNDQLSTALQRLYTGHR